jgi:hypothetical protein
MCGGTPKVETRDLKAEQLLADREATRRSNEDIAARRAARVQSSLISNYGGAAGLGSSAISVQRGKDTLG